MIKIKNENRAIEIRTAAIEAVSSILSKRQNADTSINLVSKKYNIEGKDKSLLSQIVFGVLKNLSFLDYILHKLLHRGKFPSENSANALRVGAYQIAFTRIPDYAAVDSTVEAFRKFKSHRGEISLVNAVLRAFAVKFHDIELPNDELEYLAVKYSHPRWLVLRWMKRCGREITEKMLAANNLPPPRTFRINTSLISSEKFRQSLEDNGIKYSNTQFDNFINLEEKIPIENFAPFSEGYLSVQDAAFAIPIILLDPDGDERILEIGAAPGGKTSHIIEKISDRIGNFYAGDISHRRNLMILENLKRLHHPIPEIITFDVKNPPFLSETFDKIFIDAPCSSFGVIRRHPEIRWFRKIDDIKRLVKIQREIIRSAYRLLKRKGIMVFTTCTIEQEENRGAVETMQKLGMKILPLAGKIPEQFIEPNGIAASTFPYRDNLDGSFTVVARK